MPVPAPDARDPTHTLDGWRLPAPAPLQALALREILPQCLEAPPRGRWPELPDAALPWAAELVLHHDAGLRAAHAQALRELVEAERSASVARLNDAYARQGRVARRSA